MQDTKHIRWDFYSVAWVMPQGWDFGCWGAQVVNVFKDGHLAYQIDKDDEQNSVQVIFSS